MQSKYFSKPNPVKRIDLWKFYFGESIEGQCLCNCGNTIKKYNAGFVKGHIIPFTANPPDKMWNILPICVACNQSMGSQNLLNWVCEGKFLQIRMNYSLEMFKQYSKSNPDFNSSCVIEGRKHVIFLLDIIYNLYCKVELTPETKYRFFTRFFMQPLPYGISRDVYFIITEEAIHDPSTL